MRRAKSPMPEASNARTRIVSIVSSRSHHGEQMHHAVGSQKPRQASIFKEHAEALLRSRLRGCGTCNPFYLDWDNGKENGHYYDGLYKGYVSATCLQQSAP